jgi:laminin alpha 3/5
VQFGEVGVDTQGSCRLPVSPALDPDLDINSGLRFGTKDGSYIEYVKKNLPAMMVDQNRFQVEFKTTSSEGLIFFMVHEEGKTDFIALFVKGGKLVYSFNCGSGASKLATNFRVDDGKWHSVEFSRVAKHGKLVFDSIEVKVEAHNRASLGSTTNLEVKPNIYLGGVEPSIASSDDLKRDLQLRGNGDIKGFIGCLRNLKYEVSRNGKTRMKSLGTKWERNNKVIPCSEKVEPGYFFGRGGGRIRAEKRFRVGLDFDITMMIKPRNLTGILAAVRGRRDYLVLAMNEGAIEFTVDNGRGPIQATFQPGDKHEFCNGEWHEIHAVKAKNVVTLSVNKIFAQPGIGVPGVSSTDTNNPLFLGGHPRPGKFSIRGDQVNYSGCMKEVVIEGKPVEMTADRLIGDIHSHVCPTI